MIKYQHFAKRLAPEKMRLARTSARCIARDLLEQCKKKSKIQDFATENIQTLSQEEFNAEQRLEPMVPLQKRSPESRHMQVPAHRACRIQP
ncbi:unnamed protein product [Dovyalis caffra]|uniref:Uncharacterized protein n=1 Tax=Dovyalis caffra TaxID=77055 RepID=A0AAV1QXZ4_9ROSI|nr:unnamed protein product [Dovyalis caffra]